MITTATHDGRPQGMTGWIPSMRVPACGGEASLITTDLSYRGRKLAGNGMTRRSGLQEGTA
jgi:hypothetical protein